jgi:hypothetical protein
MNIFQIHKIPYITSLFHCFGYIIPFNIKLVNMSNFRFIRFIIAMQLFHCFSYTIKFTIFLLNVWVLQIREFHYTDAINNIWTHRNIYVMYNTLL